MSSKNREQFTVLYHQYGRLVRNFLFRLGARAQLDDLTQETFVRAWKNVDQLREPEAAKAWILKIALHQFYDWGRSHQAKFVELHEDTSVEARGLQITVDARMDTEAALEALPIEQRSVCVLHYLEDLSVQEIAEILQIPEGTVKTRLMKARERMRATLTDPPAGKADAERRKVHE